MHSNAGLFCCICFHRRSISKAPLHRQRSRCQKRGSPLGCPRLLAVRHWRRSWHCPRFWHMDAGALLLLFKILSGVVHRLKLTGPVFRDTRDDRPKLLSSWSSLQTRKTFFALALEGSVDFWSSNASFSHVLVCTGRRVGNALRFSFHRQSRHCQ